jgi:hypothetical protein
MGAMLEEFIPEPEDGSKASLRLAVNNETPSAKLAQSSAEFVAGFTPPDYLIDGLLQRRFLYSLTAATGTGKTAIALLLAAHVSQGLKIGELEVTKGRVLYFAGENPDDIRMRWLAVTQQLGLTPEDVDNVHFVPGVFKFSEIGQRIRDEMAEQELSLVIVDTSAAYFETDDENSNTQMGAHARRLRQLVQLEGGPTVLVCCHPTKNAAADSLLPRGGGAFLAEVDGNLTAKKDDSAVELHMQGKFRGPDFAPISFLLKTVTHERLKDKKGRPIPTVIAQVLSEDGLRDLAARNRDEEDRVLLSIDNSPHQSSRGRAEEFGWRLRTGKVNHMRVVRAERELERQKLISRVRDGWEITDRGKRELKRLKGGDPKG